MISSPHSSSGSTTQMLLELLDNVEKFVRNTVLASTLSSKTLLQNVVMLLSFSSPRRFHYLTSKKYALISRLLNGVREMLSSCQFFAKTGLTKRSNLSSCQFFA